MPALADCRWWFESLLAHSEVSSATPSLPDVASSPAFGPVWRPGWALAPFSAVFSFCCLLCFSAGETQVWLGDLRVVVFCWFLWLCVLIDLRAPMNICPCTNLFSAYIHVRTDTRGKKKVQCGALVQFVRWSLPLGIWLHL